ncbi:exonuclease [Trypanosoma grayi]|uniref:exonuclease n=1 Tax=Trypanosoma grayi TaxID=71804 RepID=UPI0004F40EBD|nr:exonuclease [Trypanosoma grayi]KEG14918.1 exonuclease [Trypanosoma grayi]
MHGAEGEQQCGVDAATRKAVAGAWVMQSARTRDLAQEVASIRKRHQQQQQQGPGDAGPSDGAGGDDGSDADNDSSILSVKKIGFEILLPYNNARMEPRHRQLVREAQRHTVSSAHGTSDAVDRRYGSSSQGKTRVVSQPFSHLLVCDFEATCDTASVHYPHEIIEFPVVCVDTARLCVVAEFHSYVRPVKNPRLTSFCCELTGITQAQVDAAPTLPEVLQRFTAWLHESVYPLCRRWKQEHAEGLSGCLHSQQRHFAYDEKHNAAWVDCEKMVCMATDGPWDMRKFMYECSVLRDGYEFPPLFYRWVNVRHSFAEHFRSRPRKLTDMLRKLGLTFHGHHHSGIDDSHNIARILIELLRRGYRVHRVSTIKYAHTGGDVATTMAELLEELSEEDRKTHRRNGENKRRHNAGKRTQRRQ